MRIHLIAVGTRMPSWVAEGYNEYARRLPRVARDTAERLDLGDVTTLPALFDALEDRTDDVRRAAALAIGAIAPDEHEAGSASASASPAAPPASEVPS